MIVGGVLPGDGCGDERERDRVSDATRVALVDGLLYEAVDSGGDFASGRGPGNAEADQHGGHFFGARFGGNLARGVALTITILVSFVYVVAQIYGVGLITSRLSGIPFEIGIFVGLGGVLVCSFLGGMRAVTWTQVAQYVILIIAYLLPGVRLKFMGK